ncbi:hypothetical protein [Staphylococcus aureus]|uniref:hypothetical protein n=1 Tax=Staphylococcus aureus TaxID=1280 RepID=UPI0013F6207D|nr:hypothetical protein [Staphylococcus aureus]NHC98367.1 hypothetical protein [Staphylococcus aureus]NHE14310.1 hypothetical protein [Staphylococcus aureus]
MAYEYEGKLLDYASGSKTYEEYKAMTQELQEVYRKAKAFDEILNIEDNYNKEKGFSPCVEEYTEDVENIISKFTEDKQND